MKTRCFSTLMALFTLAFMSVPADAQKFIWFGSDVHLDMSDGKNWLNWEAPNFNGFNNFAGFLGCVVFNPENMYGSYGCDFVGLVGDQTRWTPGTIQSDAYYDWCFVNNIFNFWNTRSNSNAVLGCSKGNHDGIANSYNVNGPVTQPSQFADIYAISSDDFTSSNNFSSLESWFNNTKDDGKIKIIMSHYPLHTLKPGVSQTAAVNIFNKLQTWSDYPLDIIFLWGHTHSHPPIPGQPDDPDWDANTSPIATPGQHMAYNPFDLANMTYISGDAYDLKFTYAGASYISKPGNYYYQGNMMSVWTGDNSIVGNDWQHWVVLSRILPESNGETVSRYIYRQDSHYLCWDDGNCNN